MKPYAILHPYIVRARILSDFTLPDGRVVTGPPEARWLKASINLPGGELGQVIAERQLIGASYVVHDPSPRALAAAWFRLGNALAEAFDRELSRPMTVLEFQRIQLSRGWLI